MFTVKLYREGRARVIGANSLTVTDESACLKGVTLHQVNGDDEVYYVGTLTSETAYADEHRVYERAIVENANGRTTEMIYAPPAAPAAVMPIGRSPAGKRGVKAA